MDGECIEPPINVKMQYYTEMFFIFHKVLGRLDSDSARVLFAEFVHENAPSMTVTLNISLPGENSPSEEMQLLRNHTLCETYYSLAMRENMYPDVVTETKCSTRNCKNIGANRLDSIYKCKEVKTLVPAILRSAACDDMGFYIYYPVVEYVSAGCMCMASLDK